MKKTLAFLAAVVVAGAAAAATRWTTITTDVSGKKLPPNVVAVQGTFTATNGTDAELATTTSTNLGLPLDKVGGFVVMAETASGRAMTAGGKFVAYMLNAKTGKWEPVSDGSLDLVAAAAARQAWPGFSVTAQTGRVAFEPSGIGTPATVTIFGTVNR